MDERSDARLSSRPVDLRRTERSLGSAVSGYGLSPSGARERAAVVRAVTDDPGIRQRPVPVVIVTALVALAALGIWGWQLYASISEDAPLSLLFWAGLATFLASAAVCSWAWQLYDVRKAIVMWLAFAFLGVAAALIIVLVLVALKGGGDDIDIDLGGLLDRITGSPGRGHRGVTVDFVAPLVLDTIEGAGQGFGGAYEPPTERPDARLREEPTEGPACPSCGRTITVGLLICPRCGTRTG